MSRLFENVLLLYARRFPIRMGKYRLVERFGKSLSPSGDNLRRAKLAYGNYQMDCDLRMMLQRQFYFFGTYFLEERVLANWTAIARESKLIFDIGANAGIYSLAAAAANPHADIHAFEPTPEIASKLLKTVEMNGLNKRLHMHQTALARETGSAFLNLFSGENDDNEGMNFVTPNGRRSDSVPISTISLDEFCSQMNVDYIDLIKIDVQGNEPEVLAGAKRLIQTKALRTIFFELNWNHQDPNSCAASKSISMLESAGYQFADPNARMEFKPAGSWLQTLSDVVAAVHPRFNTTESTGCASIH